MAEAMSEQEAVDALMEAAQEDGFERSDVAAQRAIQEDVNEQAATPSPEDSADEGTTPDEEDSFLKHFDPDKLPDDMVPVYKGMQGDYTRAKQELAERNRQFDALEQYGGIEPAVQALDWIGSLADPNNALALHRELTSALQAEGYSLEEASEVASRQVDQAVADEEGLDDENEQFNQLKTELEGVKETLARQEEEAFQNRIASQMELQEAEIRQQHPDWDDEVFEKGLYNLAYATGANLEQAAEIYQELESGILGRYIDKKSTVSTVRELPATAEGDQAPATPRDLYDKDLEDSVNRFIAERAAAEQ